jgi:D-2-hydroxyacid dehydrogenase (NADP+)
MWREEPLPHQTNLVLHRPFSHPAAFVHATGSIRYARQPIVSAVLAAEDRLDRRLLVVVDAAGASAGEKRESPIMGVRGLASAQRPDRGAADAVHATRELGSLLSESDFVALTCPLTRETENLIDAEAFARMKSSAYLINVARGRVVDEAALIEARASGLIAGAGIDVTEEEPLAPNSPLWGMEHVLLTPHTAVRPDIMKTM